MNADEATPIPTALSRPLATPPMLQLVPANGQFSGGMPELLTTLAIEDACNDLGVELGDDELRGLARRLVLRTAQHIALNYEGCTIVPGDELGLYRES